MTTDRHLSRLFDPRRAHGRVGQLLLGAAILAWLLLVACRSHAPDTVTPNPGRMPTAAVEVRTVKIEALDGVELHAEYHDPGLPGPGALLLHMCSPQGSQQGWAPLAHELSDAGFHVLTFDYRSFGLTPGERPMLDSIEEAMGYWREHWIGDAQAALNWLLRQEGVDESHIAFGGASCGVFLTLELSHHYPEVGALVLLAGPTDSQQESYLRDAPELPIFGATGDDPPAPEWMNRIFSWTEAPQSRLVLYRDKSHGTELFGADPKLAFTIRQWLLDQFLESNDPAPS